MKITKPITERLVTQAGKGDITPIEVTSPAGGAVQHEVLADGTCVLTFDCPGTSANVFNESVLRELDEHIGIIGSDARVKGLVLRSAKESIFIAGADLHALSASLESSAEPSPGLAEFIELGQRVFTHLAALKVPTVAAIHGACVGGGMELALACDYRIASPDKVTKLGFPETQLGILPAWGGCTRLPKLVGLPTALDLILKGKMLPARKAQKVGLVDATAPKERLLDLARQWLRKGKRPASRKLNVLLTNNSPVARLTLPYVRTKVMKETYGHYPAALKALEVTCLGVGAKEEESLKRERDAILALAGTEASRNLMRLFFLQERAKKIQAETGFSLRPVAGRKVAKSFDNLPLIKRPAVIGAGVMGAGIAHWLSSRKLPVLMRDINPDAVARGMTAIHKNYDEAVKRHILTRTEARAGYDRIYPGTGDVSLRNMDIVIEAAVEKMDLKKELFRKLAAQTGPETILATNTSALSVSEIADSTPSPDRVVGIHFFNPVHRMQLVEVVVGHHTDPMVLERAVRFVQQIGKLPVVVSDSPGFLVNRILMPYLMEAATLFTAGARIEDIDAAMLEFGMPMGPLRLVDEVGLDVAHHVAETLTLHFNDRMNTPAVLKSMLGAGLLGKKSGQGFYRHEQKKPLPNEAVRMYQQPSWADKLSRADLQRRMVLLMVNEAARCLEEEVVTAPEDVDFAMVMGTGFAPFRGGPLRYADSLGLARVVKEMQHEADMGDPYFTPCSLLQRKALRNETFYPQKGVIV
ncbi:MAG TPA: 3-hydroxyacyl-CoA dehydrogenase NAD-binding domain-containing protein [Verrucomicrobiae bacterium]